MRDWSGPIRHLTQREEEVARLLARGLSAKRIGAQLGISASTVGGHVESIASALPNPDELHPRTLVMLWAAHRAWMERKTA